MSFFKVLRDKFYSQHMNGWKTVWTYEKLGPVWITIILIQMDISSLILIICCTLPTSSTFFASIAFASWVIKLVWSASVAFGENSLSFSLITFET